MAGQILGVQWASTGTSVPALVGTAQAGDLLVALTARTSGAQDSAMVGCGATWELVYTNSYGGVWIGRNAGALGVVTRTGGNQGVFSVWWIRGVSDSDFSWADQALASVTLKTPAVTVGTTQIVLVAAAPVSTWNDPATNPLPSVAAWNTVSSGNIRRGHAAPSTPDVYQATMLRSGAPGAMTLAVIGMPPPSPATALAATPTTTSLDLSWTAPVGSTVDSYSVKVGTNVPIDVGNVTQHTATGLTPETEYAIEVIAINEAGESSPTTLNATTLAMPVEPEGPGPVPTITWDDNDDRYFATGLDRGVLYPKTGNPVPWNGLTGIDEIGNGTKTILYRDGRIFYADVEPGDYEGALTAYFYPDEFAVCAGIPEATDGLFVDNQKPQRFSLSYRNLVGSGMTGDIFGYQIHLVYNATASIGTRSRKTMTNTPEIQEFAFDLVAVPVKLPGMRPSAHYILDTRFIDATTLAQLEAVLYGDGVTPGRMPDPVELFDLMHFGSAITFTDTGNGTWKAQGARANLIDNGDGTWQILNVNGTDNGDGTYTLEDTP